MHTFRHTFISHMQAKGADVEMVSRYIGYADSKITKRIYTHLTKGAKTDIAKMVDTAFGEKVTATITATIPPQSDQKEPITTNDGISESRAWVPELIKSENGNIGKRV